MNLKTILQSTVVLCGARYLFTSSTKVNGEEAACNSSEVLAIDIDIDVAEDLELDRYEQYLEAEGLGGITFQDDGYGTFSTVGGKTRSKNVKRLRKDKKKKLQDSLAILLGPVYCDRSAKRVFPNGNMNDCGPSQEHALTCTSCTCGYSGPPGTPMGIQEDVDPTSNKITRVEESPDVNNPGIANNLDRCGGGCCGQVECYDLCSSYSSAFDVSCLLITRLGCAKSRADCNKELINEIKFWSTFLINLMPGADVRKLFAAIGKGTARAAKKAVKQYARKVARDIRKKFRKEMRSLKKELKKAIKEDLTDLMLDMLLEDTLEEMEVQAPFDSYKTRIEEAAKDFGWSLSPFDAREYESLMKRPRCNDVGTQFTSADIAWDLPEKNNVAYGRPTRQSSTFRDADSSLAVDGTLSGDYHAQESTMTQPNDALPYWEVELEQYCLIEEIIVYGREDWRDNWHRLKGFKVEVFRSDSLDWEVRDPSQGNYPPHETVLKMSAFGDRVRVSLPRPDYLMLAEVEVIASSCCTGSQTDIDCMVGGLKFVSTRTGGVCAHGCLPPKPLPGLPSGIYKIKTTYHARSGMPANWYIGAGEPSPRDNASDWVWVVDGVDPYPKLNWEITRTDNGTYVIKSHPQGWCLTSHGGPSRGQGSTRMYIHKNMIYCPEWNILGNDGTYQITSTRNDFNTQPKDWYLAAWRHPPTPPPSTNRNDNSSWLHLDSGQAWAMNWKFELASVPPPYWGGDFRTSIA